MRDCETIMEALCFGQALDPQALAHLERCERCQADAAATEVVASAFATTAAIAPPADLTARTLAVTAPLLARRARRAAVFASARALGAALLPLPAVLVFAIYVVRSAYELLRVLLPETVSAYLVFNYAALLALLFALTYGAIPLLAERQLRAEREVRHA